MAKRILLLDTPDGAQESLERSFERASPHPVQVVRLDSARLLLQQLETDPLWDMVVVDCDLGDGETTGWELLPTLRRLHPELSLVAVAATGDVQRAARAVEAGANDFLVRAGHLEERVATLLQKIRPHLSLLNKNRLLSEQNRLLQEAQHQRYQILGQSPQILHLLQRIERVADIPRPVLLQGERGTGKELVARAIHAAANNSKERPLVIVNCAAFPDALLESELFGHERGAFTGATQRTPGKFELAHEGTLFLDEIGHMSLSFQQKILRVVEYGTFSRVGGQQEIHSNARIIAATNADLRQMMQEERFLPDLYDRLSFEVMEVSPLRDREGDIERLAHHFLQQFVLEIPALQGKYLGEASLDALQRYPFPGNVRELKHIIERAAYRGDHNEITPDDLGLCPPHSPSPPSPSFYGRVEAFKKQLIFDALQQAQGNQAQAARDLELSYHQFRYFLRKYN